MIPAFGIGVALILHVLLASSSTGKVLAARTNITIDDTDVPHWSFVGLWHSVSPSTPCSDCATSARPDPGLAHNNTWHDGFHSSGAFTFQGSAGYIYGIDIANPADITFGVSDAPITSFHYYGRNGYVYNSLFFSATDLDPTVQHTVTWILSQSTSDGGGEAGLLDYAVVTIDQADPLYVSFTPRATKNSDHVVPYHPAALGPSVKDRCKSKTGAIVGSVVGVIGGFTLLGVAFIFLRRRRSAARRPSKNPESHPAPPTNGGAAAGPSLDGEDWLTMSRPFLSGHNSSVMSATPSTAVSMRERQSAPTSPNSKAPPGACRSCGGCARTNDLSSAGDYGVGFTAFRHGAPPRPGYGGTCTKSGG